MQYLFSVIIPIYNCENYLRECIESTLSQTIGKEKIQIILVNDSSPDNSEAICKEYESKYNNVIYIKQPNQGVSAARNNGIEHATGEIINFLDSDDKWDTDAFRQAYEQIKAHPEIKMFASRVKFFEARTDYHPLDYKFKEDKIVDIKEDFQYPQLFSNSAFFRRNSLEDIRFSPDVRYGEDVRFNADFLMRHGQYMILSKPVYYYRRRASGMSAVQVASKSKAGFFERYDTVYTYMFEKSKEKYGYILPYFQYLVAEDLQWYIKKATVSVMKKCRDEYTFTYKTLLQDIDDDIILSMKNVSIAKKHYMLTLKHGEYENFTLNKKGSIIIGETAKYSLKTKKILTIQTIDIGKKKVRMCGSIKYPLNKKYFEVLYSVNDNMKALPLKTDSKGFYGFDGVLYYHDYFDITVPKLSVVKFYIRFKDNNPVQMKIHYDILSHLNHKSLLKYVKNGTMVYNLKESIHIEPYKFNPRRTLRLIKQLSFSVIMTRMLIRFIKPLLRREIWLVSDRRNVAGDNGEAFFEYLAQHKEINSYFVIDKSSADYERLKKTGKVTDAGSAKHRILHLLASKNISSQADLFAINPLENKSDFRDISNSDFVFLQHGITKDNLSTWLNKRNKDIKLFITSAKPEYKSIKEYPYDYDHEVVLTGMPRFDKLENKEQNLIAIMPTWRYSIEGKLIDGVREYSEELKYSEYFKFYNRLINDERLKEFAEKNNYKILFVVHPCHSPNIKDFSSDFVDIQTNVSYKDVFSKASLLVTDYSSVAFDFAYLRKPVIYTQFDKKEFFSSHTYSEGYFSYEENGFGPVVYNYEDTINAILQNIELSDAYKKKIDDFFVFSDRKNCERTFEEIKKI